MILGSHRWVTNWFSIDEQLPGPGRLYNLAPELEVRSIASGTLRCLVRVLPPVHRHAPETRDLQDGRGRILDGSPRWASMSFICPDPSDRDHLPKRREQHARGEVDRRREPLGDRGQGRRPRRDPPGTRNARRLRCIRRRSEEAGHRCRSRLRHPVFARSSLGDRTPRMVQPPARRDDPPRGESSEEVSGRLPRQLRHGSRSSWVELKRILDHWIAHGVTIFRVDNPHTKSFPFWEWVIGAESDHPDVIFLAEAFTRPPVMQPLAKLGFTQSYTYFTWRNTKQEIIEYMNELTQTEMRGISVRTSSPIHRTSCTSTCSLAGRRHSRSGWSSRRCSRRPTGSTRDSNFSKTRPRRMARGVPGFREIRTETTRLLGPG